jgi:hypothetical protein
MNILKFAILLVISIIFLFALFRDSSNIYGRNPTLTKLIQCEAQIAKVSLCYSSDGNWTSKPTGIPFEDYGISLNCSVYLNDTSWYNDETHFNCGKQPA